MTRPHTTPARPSPARTWTARQRTAQAFDDLRAFVANHAALQAQARPRRLSAHQRRLYWLPVTKAMQAGRVSA